MKKRGVTMWESKWHWLAYKLPRKLVYWAAIRLINHAIYTTKVDAEHISAGEVLRQWEKLINNRGARIRYLFGKEWLHWHWQNLNVKEDDRYREIWRGSGFWDGRAWLHIGRRTTLGANWCFGKRSWGSFIGLDLGGGDSGGEIMFKVALFRLFMLFFTLEDPRLSEYMPGKWADSKFHPSGKFWMNIERDIGLSYSEGYFRLNLWRNPNEWSRGQPWWWEMSVNIPDLLFGRAKYLEENIQQGRIAVTLPEAAYPATYKFYDAVWKRPRWKEKRLGRVELDFDTPIPIPGKGENSWDIDDDAVHSVTMVAASPEEAVQKEAADILKRRQRYGGANWKPAPIKTTA